MYQKKREEDIRCPLEYGLAQFGGKWSSRILCVLHSCGTLRYGELRDEMVNITDAVLTATLRKLVEDGLVERRAFEEIPPRVQYTLTARGQTVIPILQAICRWAGAQSRPYQEPILRQCQKCDHYQQKE